MDRTGRGRTPRPVPLGEELTTRLDLVWRRAAVPMDHLPLSALAPVDLRRAEHVGARLTIDHGLRVLVAHRVGHVAADFGRDDVESERVAAGKRLLERGEELV